MTNQRYTFSDLPVINGALRMIENIMGDSCMDIRYAGKALSVLSTQKDVPVLMRRYFDKVGKELTDTEARLKSELSKSLSDGLKLFSALNAKMSPEALCTEDWEKLQSVNMRLQALEKSLHEMMAAMHEKIGEINPAGVEWDAWDDSEIILWLKFGADVERPAYQPEKWAEDGIMEPLEIRVKVSSCGELNTWGLNDGKNHSDMGVCEGHPMQHFHQCYLFHELWDHTEVGLYGMLNLRSLWIEIISHRSANFIF